MGREPILGATTARGYRQRDDVIQRVRAGLTTYVTVSATVDGPKYRITVGRALWLRVAASLKSALTVRTPRTAPSVTIAARNTAPTRRQLDAHAG